MQFEHRYARFFLFSLGMFWLSKNITGIELGLEFREQLTFESVQLGKFSIFLSLCGPQLQLYNANLYEWPTKICAKHL